MNNRALVLLGVIVAASVGMEARAQSPHRMATKSAPAVRGAAAPGAKIPSATAEINAKFKDPELDVQDWRSRFESDSREVYAARQQVLEACHIRPGDRVADVGAGTGFYTLMFAKAVGPDGWVVPVEVSTKFLEFLNQRAAQQGVTNITPVLGSDRSINLPPGSLNLVFICDTYHHFEYPQAILASIHRSLRDGGAGDRRLRADPGQVERVDARPRAGRQGGRPPRDQSGRVRVRRRSEDPRVPRDLLLAVPEDGVGDFTVESRHRWR